MRHPHPLTLLVAAVMVLAAGCALIVGFARIDAAARPQVAAAARPADAITLQAPLEGLEVAPTVRRDVVAAGAREVREALPARVPGQPTLSGRTAERPVPTVTGSASWYGDEFAGQRTASGSVFDPSALTCAHRTLPFGTRLKVTNLATGASVVVTVTDRGPYSGGRIIDLSAAAADAIGMMGSGTATVSLEVVDS